jgi:threonine dehydratase
VLTISAGNHGLAVAHCSEALKLDTTIVVPRSASRAKVEAIRRYPVKLLEMGAGYDEAERAARELERESGMTFVSPYNDPDVIAGQGTAAIEILEDYPDLDAIVVPIGGGGLLAGVLIAAKAIKPEIEVFGVEPTTSPTMSAALAAGAIVPIDEEETIADGLAGNIEPGSMTYPIIQRLVDGVILVTEDAIKTSIARLAREDHLIIEGAAATSIAAVADERLKGKRVCAMVTGRNIALDLFCRVLEESGSLRL